jgi:hypothetical protein
MNDLIFTVGLVAAFAVLMFGAVLVARRTRY